MKKLRELLKEMKLLRENYNEKASKLTSEQIHAATQEIKDKSAEIQEVLTEGAKDCEAGHRPMGLFHEGTPNPFEIGDPVTANRRCRAAFFEDVVEKWNDDEWLPPREPETAVLTHKDVGGNVISQKTVKVQRK